MLDVKRRQFLTLLGAAATWPFAAHGQQAAKLPTIGYLGTAAASAWAPWTTAFVQRLHELGWTDGRTIAIQYRWADGRAERWAEFAAELARLKVDVIVTGGNAAVAARRPRSSPSFSLWWTTRLPWV
jgi:putative ABC transport system substrate-binding protein